jgi:hypothetical protein
MKLPSSSRARSNFERGFGSLAISVIPAEPRITPHHFDQSIFSCDFFGSAARNPLSGDLHRRTRAAAQESDRIDQTANLHFDRLL